VTLSLCTVLLRYAQSIGQQTCTSHSVDRFCRCSACGARLVAGYSGRSCRPDRRELNGALAPELGLD
jgi:hypothetical protein